VGILHSIPQVGGQGFLKLGEITANPVIPEQATEL